jgi:hypothetical protein
VSGVVRYLSCAQTLVSLMTCSTPRLPAGRGGRRPWTRAAADQDQSWTGVGRRTCGSAGTATVSCLPCFFLLFPVPLRARLLLPSPSGADDMSCYRIREESWAQQRDTGSAVMAPQRRHQYFSPRWMEGGGAQRELEWNRGSIKRPRAGSASRNSLFRLG